MQSISFFLLAVLISLAACDGARTDDPPSAATAGAEATSTTAAPAAGGGARGDFEGRITTATTSDGERIESVMWVKGSRVRFDVETDGERGAIIRDANGRMMMVSESQRQYMYMPDVPPSDTPMRFTSLGRTETVAGYRCEYYRISDPDGVQDGDEVCITTALGFVGIGPSGSFQAADEAALRQQFRDGFLILKSPDTGDGITFEVTSVERTAVSDDLFAPPAGYTEVQRPNVGVPPRRP